MQVVPWFYNKRSARFGPPLGPELVTNGSFSEGISGWFRRGDTTFENGICRFTSLGSTGSSANNWMAYQPGIFVNDKSYRLQVRARQVTGNVTDFQCGQSYYNTTAIDQVITPTFQIYQVDFIPKGANTPDTLTIGGRVAGTIFEVDFVSVKELL